MRKLDECLHGKTASSITMRHLSYVRIAAALLTLTAASATAGATDCTKEPSTLEPRMCQSTPLLALDRLLADTYSKAAATVVDTEELASFQRRWLQSRDAFRNSPSRDLEAWYRQQTTLLELFTRHPTLLRPELGTYGYVEPIFMRGASKSGRNRYISAGSHLNTLRVEPTPDGKLRVVIQGMFRNADECHVDEIGEWQGAALVVTGPPSEEDGPKLTVTFRKDIATVQARDNSDYCGNNGDLNRDYPRTARF